jgi:hypothetical protein
MSATLSQGLIHDRFDPLKDMFNMNLASSAGLADAVANLGTKTVRIEVGPETLSIPGAEFSYNPAGYYLYNNPLSATKVTLFPGSGKISLYYAKANVNGISDPITVKVEVGGWCTETTEEWEKFPFPAYGVIYRWP